MEQIRYKSIVIPYFVSKGKTFYVMVEDSKYKELTFPGGGCKAYEISPYNSKNSPEITLQKGILKCAEREFREETKGIFGKRQLSEFFHKFSFFDYTRSASEKAKNKAEKVTVKMMYNVFMIRLTHIRNFEHFRQKFHLSRSVNKETSNILALQKSEIQKKNIWTLIRTKILPML